MCRPTVGRWSRARGDVDVGCRFRMLARSFGAGGGAVSCPRDAGEAPRFPGDSPGRRGGRRGGRRRGAVVARVRDIRFSVFGRSRGARVVLAPEATPGLRRRRAPRATPPEGGRSRAPPRPGAAARKRAAWRRADCAASPCCRAAGRFAAPCCCARDPGGVARAGGARRLARRVRRSAQWAHNPDKPGGCVWLCYETSRAGGSGPEAR